MRRNFGANLPEEYQAACRKLFQRDTPEQTGCDSEYRRCIQASNLLKKTEIIKSNGCTERL